MRAVADRMEQVGLDYPFVGGSIVNLLLDHPALSPARPTDDVDVIVEAVTSRRHSEVEAALRRVGFAHDMRENAPRRRWVLGGLTVDIMPTEGALLGLNTAWFKEALGTATEVIVSDNATDDSRARFQYPGCAARHARTFSAFSDPQ